MTVRKLSRSLWSLLITLTLAFAGVSFTGAANAIPGETGDIYRAYAEDSPSTENTNIYVHPDGDDSNPIVGYCFNIHKQWPTENKSYMANKTFYLHKDVSGVASFADAPRKKGPSGELLSPKSFDQAVLKVILNGYPNNSDLQRKYELSDEEYRMITQDAFHYYADNTNASKRISQNNTYMKVFDILVGKPEDNAIKPVPENAVINILEYDPNGKSNFQNLITVDFRPGPVDEPTTADVTFSKVAAGQGEELPGATLTLTGGDNFSETWVSTGTAKQLTLAPGEYTMTEKA
ncbi:MAG: thioester-forming surface-anchored protein, partial [Atopobium sp.]|nr:thioester-forming surface-anchored protein [Atopobium sp.]